MKHGEIENSFDTCDFYDLLVTYDISVQLFFKLSRWVAAKSVPSTSSILNVPSWRFGGSAEPRSSVNRTKSLKITTIYKDVIFK